MKLKQIDTYKCENVPDHVLQEITDLNAKFMNAVMPLLDSEKPNLSLSAINHLLAYVTKSCVSDDVKEQRRAALHQARAIIGNMAMLNGLTIEEFMKEED
jgi:hypothetical protein